MLSRFLDVERPLASCVQIPKQETVKTAETRIANVIDLKHILELVEPFRDALRDGENSLLVAYRQVARNASLPVYLSVCLPTCLAVSVL